MVPDSRRCVLNCAATQTRYGSSTARQRGISRKSGRGSSKACSNLCALSWHCAARTPVQQVRHGCEYRALPLGLREEKFARLGSVTLDDEGWTECSTALRASFLPKVAGVWAEFAPIADLFVYDGSGVMPGRTWVIAPDRTSLERRWKVLQSETDPTKKETLFHPHLLNGEPGDKHTNKRLRRGNLWS